MVGPCRHDRSQTFGRSALFGSGISRRGADDSRKYSSCVSRRGW